MTEFVDGSTTLQFVFSDTEAWDEIDHDEITVLDSAFSLEINFQVRFDEDHEPYGDRQVTRSSMEIIWDKIDFILDGVSVTLSYLYEKFGETWVDKEVEKAVEKSLKDDGYL